jgi:SAM-dependent methyltransferase
MVASALACAVTTIGIVVISRYEGWARDHSAYFMSFAAGVLISVSFIHIIPESFEMNGAAPVFLLVGFLAIYLINYVRGVEGCRRLYAEEMGELSEPFDLIYTRYALHHLDWPRRLPENARAVLRPEGVLPIVDWAKGARTGIAESYFALDTVARWVREAGFQVLAEAVREQSMVIVARRPKTRALLTC